MSTLYQALVRYANESTTITPAYFGETTFLWQLDLGPDGVPVDPDLLPLTRPVAGKRGTPAVKPGMTVLAPKLTRANQVLPMLGSDRADYVLGWDDEETAGKKTEDRHRSFVDLTRAWAGSPEAAEDPAPRALLAFLEHHLGAVVRPEHAGCKDPVLVRVDGRPVFDSPSAAAFWARHASGAKGSGATGVCLVCGRGGPLVSTLPQGVKGHFAPGGQTSGVAPISINEIAYGFGLKKGLGQVPVCEACATAIPAALNDLLGDSTRTHRDETAATTWWVEGDLPVDPWRLTDDADPAEVGRLIASVHNGQHLTPQLRADEFHSLTVSGNAARLVVRRWNHIPVALLLENVAAWFEDIEVEPGRVDRPRHLPLWRLATATGRWEKGKEAGKGRYLLLSDRAGRHPHGITQALEQAALTRAELPPAVMAHVIQRIAADHHIDDARAAVLRLALTRSPLSKEKVMPGLDESLTAPCYVAGRLFAVYEDLQVAAARVDGGSAPNATFADKNLAGAIVSPQLVLAAGGKQSAAWLSKLRKKGWDTAYRKRIDAIIALLDPAHPVPAQAGTHEQALFVMGYHHQHNTLWRERSEASAAKKLAEQQSTTPDEEIA